MKAFPTIFFLVILKMFILLGIDSFSQDLPVNTERLENLVAEEESDTEDDGLMHELQSFTKHPVNINTASATELEQLTILDNIQVLNLLSYRNLFGRLINIYELQAVPGWDLHTIKKVLPFITINSREIREAGFWERFRDGDHSILLRASQGVEKSMAYKKSNPGSFPGSAQKFLFRYRYQFKNLLSYGLLAEKDPGESFFSKDQKKGFDFYSFHISLRNLGIIQHLVIGDFTVNMAQGLMQYQGMGFKKTSDVINIKRQSPVLRAYNSAGEFYFQRGAAITLKKRKLESTMFASIRKLDAHAVFDSTLNEEIVTSFLTSGYHRTQTELEMRNKLSQVSFGGNLKIQTRQWHLSANAVRYQFSKQIEKRDQPYNLYALRGNHWHNAGLDYSYTFKNLHFFGEAAIDKNLRRAFINGIMLSADRRVDLSFLFRNIDKQYQAVYANTFTENTMPSNESGIYFGLTIRPFNGCKFDAYADVYKFPWLKYKVDAPTSGKDFLAQLTVTPNRQVEVYSRYRSESKSLNQLLGDGITNSALNTMRRSWRTHIIYKVSHVLSLRKRAEVVWYDEQVKKPEQGFLSYVDVLYKPVSRPFSFVARIQYFETGGYYSRVYAYENDVMYSHSIPASAGKGLRYYAILEYDLSKKLSFWLRWAQTIYFDRTTTGEGLDLIVGNRQSEVKVQVLWEF